MWFQQQNCFVCQFERIEVQDQVSAICFLLRPHSLHCKGHFLPVILPGPLSVCVICVLNYSYKDTSPIELEPTQMTSFYPLPLSKPFLQICSCSGFLGLELAHVNFGAHNSTYNKFLIEVWLMTSHVTMEKSSTPSELYFFIIKTERVNISSHC